MKALPFLLTCFFAATAFAGPTTRMWTDKQKRKVEATFVKIEGDMISLQTREGAVRTFPLTNLSAGDQAIAKTLAPFIPSVALTATVAQSAGEVDRLIMKQLTAKGVKPNPPSTDEQFVRRAYLDIVGRIPSYDEASGFMADSSPNKRAKLIDMLLDTEGYTTHLYDYLADMFRVIDDTNQPMQRSLPYIQWLKKQVNDNLPYDKMVSALLTADGKMWDNGATGYLLRDSGMLLDNLSNTFTVFLGTDLACAQCHDHPFAEWTQKQFYELAAFFGATVTNLNDSQFKGGDPKDRIMAEMTSLAEKSGTDMKQYEGTIDQIIDANRRVVADTKENRLRLPMDYKYKDGKPGEPVKPKLIRWKGEDKRNDSYKQNTKKQERLRDSFAAWATHKDNPRFAITIANRLWKRALGVGVAEPVTNVDDPKNSTNPELLAYLGNEMKRLKFNLRDYQKIIYNTQAWQREATVDDVPMGTPYHFQGPLLRRMSAEQTWDSFMTLILGQPDLYKGTNGTSYGNSISLDLAKTTGATMAGKLNAFLKMRDQGKSDTGSLADAGIVQMGMDRPKTLEFNGMKLLRAAELEQPSIPGHFLREFGQSSRVSTDGSSREGSSPQVLMLMNGPVQQMITDHQSLIFRTMNSKATAEEKAESVFISILARRPTPNEKAFAVKQITEAGEEGPSNLIWALINSLEFLFVQ
jgi:Protein of unknown function (DUF1549)/Protein of unknown function (DUF1553)